ncbi:hypothetical protein [Salimicrobium halophilum]|uniref:Uncharacterized protein n=1 Tax=Salimicrobium halophilum TaxID=86666 RepID=A0A1G8R8Q9_9BACI|nr:hypothetical protein [Salimicrobium halophilum]SDJ13356.1 hypothetical protein SAMN04490247_0895 [Salimicrobium halophilum]
MEWFLIKKIAVLISVFLLLSVLFIFYQHNQPPVAKDITNSKQAGAINVLTIEKIGGGWFSLYYNHQQEIKLGFLEQNVLGTWEVNSVDNREEAKREPFEAGIYWNVESSPGSQKCYYYGAASNQIVEKIKLSINEESYKVLDLKSSGTSNVRYFLEVHDDDECGPYHFKAVSEGGHLIAEEKVFSNTY